MHPVRKALRALPRVGLRLSQAFRWVPESMDGDAWSPNVLARVFLRGSDTDEGGFCDSWGALDT